MSAEHPDLSPEEAHLLERVDKLRDKINRFLKKRANPTEEPQEAPEQENQRDQD